MPVRIYDISKKLGLENKEVLSKAKELGIAAARVASSSLDKITAEYLEQQLIQAHPGLVAQSPSTPAAPAAAVSEPIIVVTGPPPQDEDVESTEITTATALLEPPETPEEKPAPIESAIPPSELAEAPPTTVQEPIPKAPPPPVGPKVGDKVGF